MYSVVRQIKGSFTVCTALIITVITTGVRAVHFKTCGPEELAQCPKTFSDFTDTGPLFVQSKEDLDAVCPDLNKSLKCIFAYSRLCMTMQQRMHFQKLLHGTASMVRELCKNGTYQEEYLSHAPCMQRVASETEACFSRYSEAMTQIQAASNKQWEQEDSAHRKHHHHRRQHHHNKSEAENVYKYEKAKQQQPEDDGLKNVCCSFQEYVDCSTQTVWGTCGEDAALFNRGFLNKMASSLMTMHCAEFSASDCKGSSSTSQLSSQITALSIATLLALLLR